MDWSQLVAVPSRSRSTLVNGPAPADSVKTLHRRSRSLTDHDLLVMRANQLSRLTEDAIRRARHATEFLRIERHAVISQAFGAFAECSRSDPSSTESPSTSFVMSSVIANERSPPEHLSEETAALLDSGVLGGIFPSDLSVSVLSGDTQVADSCWTPPREKRSVQIPSRPKMDWVYETPPKQKRAHLLTRNISGPQPAKKVTSVRDAVARRAEIEREISCLKSQPPIIWTAGIPMPTKAERSIYVSRFA